MKKTIYDFERKYEVQDELLNEGALEGLDERTLHETIKAMLINTIKDCCICQVKNGPFYN